MTTNDGCTPFWIVYSYKYVPNTKTAQQLLKNFHNAKTHNTEFKSKLVREQLDICQVACSLTAYTSQVQSN